MTVMNDRDRRTRFEAQKWSAYFDVALDGAGQEHEDTLWWRVSDEHSFDIVEELVGTAGPIGVCEPACGSGGTSIKLVERFDLSELVLLDISPSAVAFAKSLVPPDLADRCEVVQGDAFATELPDDRFDLVWNVGVVEHYLPDQILDMVGEMFRITKPGGTMLIAYPNKKSVATLKAAFLGSRLGRRFAAWVPGYRFDTEILYSDSFLARLVAERTGGTTAVRYAGSALWVGAPTILVRLEQSIFPRSRFSFLSFLAVRKPMRNIGAVGERSLAIYRSDGSSRNTSGP